MSNRGSKSDRGSTSKQAASGLPRPRRWLRWGVLTAVVLAVGLLGLRPWEVTRQAPPEPELLQASSAVAEAIQAARTAVLQHPNDGDAWGKFGMVLFAHQYEHEMIPCFERARKLDPEDFRWSYYLGLGVAVSDPVRAEQAFRDALMRDPDAGVAHTRLAELLLSQQKYDEAGAHLRTALERDPQDVRAYLGMARLAMLCGDVRAAIPWAEHAGQLAPEVRGVHELLALLYQRAGNRDGAIRELQEAARTRHTDLLWNDPFAAEVLSLRHDNRSRQEQAEQLATAGKHDEAIRLLRQAITTDDREPELFAFLGRTLAEAGRLPEAAEALDRGLKRHPDATEIHFQRGTIAFLMKDLPRARREFQTTLISKPDHALAHYNLGHVELQQRDWEAAAKEFGEAIRCRPNYADSHVNLGRALLELGQTADAVAAFESALKLVPSHRQAKAMLEAAKKEVP